jgi:hypothetical protein
MSHRPSIDSDEARIRRQSGRWLLFVGIYGIHLAIRDHRSGAIWIPIVVGVCASFAGFWRFMGDSILDALSKRNSLRKPMSPRLSAVLVHHVAVHMMAEPIATGVVMSAIYTSSAINTSGAFWTLLPLASIFNRFVLVNGTLEFIKALLGARFSIVLFRRFSRDAAEFDKQVLAPIFGAYGKNTFLTDPTLISASAGPNSDSEQIMGDMPARQVDEPSWRERVRAALGEADLVVFHWAVAPTENMEWEFREAARILPATRLIIFTNHHAHASIEEWLAQERRNGRGAKGALRLYVAAPERDSYGWVAKHVATFMRSLEPCDRPATAARVAAAAAEHQHEDDHLSPCTPWQDRSTL